MSAMTVSYKDVVIAIGPAAAGKTTLLNHLEEKFSLRGLSIFRVSDLDMLLGLVDEDHAQRFHIRQAADQFEITSPWIYDEAVRRLCAKVETEAPNHDILLAEIACGRGTNHDFDISFTHRIGLLPERVISRARVLHIENPLDSRLRLNANREGFSHTPERVFHGLFQEDEHLVDAVELHGGIIETISNRGSLELFLRTADEMLGI